MEKIDRKVRQMTLGPLGRRPSGAADREAVRGALERLDEYALGHDLLQQVKEVLLDTKDAEVSSKDPAPAEKQIILAKALYASRKISTQEYVFFVSSSVEGIHDSRVLDRRYDELDKISKQTNKVRRKYGLKRDEYWPTGTGPVEYKILNRQWDQIYNAKFSETLREYGLNDLADLNENNPKEYSRLRERGRRTIVHKDEIEFAIRDVVIRYEEDARRAASVGAFSAAVISLGAGLEGLLLLRCLSSPKKATHIASGFSGRLRPKQVNNQLTWNFETLIETCLQAGWLPPIKSSVATFDSGHLAHLLRQTRNHVHPGKQARQCPWVETDERAYQDADSIYIALLSTLGRVRKSGSGGLGQV